MSSFGRRTLRGGYYTTNRMKRILINIGLGLLVLGGLIWSSTHGGLLSLSGFFPMYVGVIGLVKYNSRLFEDD